jgi:magnesium transporter
MRTLTAVDEAQIKDLVASDEFFWLDLTVPLAEDIDRLERLLSLHPRCARGLSGPIGRPMLEEFETHVLLAFFGIGEKSLEPVEVRLVISGGFILTIHEQPAESLQQLTEREVHGDEGEVIYTILGALASSFYKAIDRIDDDIDTIEDEIMGNPVEAQLRRLVDVKNRLVALRRIATPQRDLLASSMDEIGSLPGLQARPRDFRDVYQQMISVSELIDSSRDVLTGAQDVYLSAVSNRLNAVMERLTLVATIFLPLAFVTGFFGQNFSWLVKHIDSFGAFLVLGIGGVLVPVGMMLVVFSRAGYMELPPLRRNVQPPGGSPRSSG